MNKNKGILLIFFLLSFTMMMQAQTLRLSCKNIDKIIKAMTLREKAELVVGGKYVVREGKPAETRSDTILAAAGLTKAIPRLGITGTEFTDGPAGVVIWPDRQDCGRRVFNATAFPVATLIASSWNKENARRIGEAMGQETLDLGCDVILTPAINIQRNPLCGRNYEYFSEDPVLTAGMATAEVLGVQSKGVGTSVKHFVANNQETWRLLNNSVIGQRALREIYLKGFELTLKNAKPWTVMASYNKLNGTWTQSKPELLHSWLRDEIGYKGLTLTDWTNDERNVVNNINADDNLMMPGLTNHVSQIVEAVKDGRIKIQTLDNAVRHMLEYIVKTPTFRGCPKKEHTDVGAHAIVSREGAEDGIILLKNNSSVLPLASGRQVALFGHGSYNGYLAGGIGSGFVFTRHTVNIAEGLRRAGYHLNPELTALYTDAHEEVPVSKAYAERRAKESDVAIVTIRRNAGEGYDRKVEKGDWMLSDVERSSLKNISVAFHQQGKKLIVLLNITAPMEVASWQELADAIVLPWTPGGEGGLAIANILTGKTNPSGHLPMTFAVAYEDIPSSKNFPSNYEDMPFDANVPTIGYTKYEEGIWVGYRYFNTKKVPVMWPFGYGLSYTTFSFYNPTVKLRKDRIEASVMVRNTGSVAGRQVAQLYVSAPKSNLEKPLRELKDFAKTRILQPGESQQLSFNIPLTELASFDEKDNSWVTDKGKYNVEIGDNVENILCSKSFTIKKRTVVNCPTVL